MLKKTLLIENKSSISAKNLQLIVKSETREGTVPIEEIGFLVLDHPEIYISIPAMNILIQNHTNIKF
ncbi:hypothetical protein BXU11_10755 [Flavobacterium sp. LM5]|uniref:hypothetical protein n=1 Tax=Flavobacterium sp. LM5 TaxID=1938610 RepID=UPI0009923A6B|nr:hypothetical protein [Flavobacterium sp. LM5]OOV26849.1 hypothetical protein BXU11_10755 [Flavobacterium sp. LM5]